MEAKETFERNLQTVVNDLEKIAENRDRGGLLDYLHDALEVEIKTDSEGRFVGAEVLFMSGGPTVWLDTQEGAVMASWNGFPTTSRELPEETNDFIDDVILEYVFKRRLKNDYL
ncbi:hypothetical protein LOB47_10190 [Lactobacillus delbrueckii subsp. lactis]|uniref:Uncharacterized protein n=1 Tax=Lactobacillus delbrueckii subsp. lactis TaxID=29397 RepID=A0A3G6JDM1_LACDL|nr:hypothetical protein [Lactobacillus delbrueckii]AZA15971.1 MAG: hypothetical protein DQL93_04980 [Lactobacillus delbrueckii subsp. lactis]MCD5607075.1 hypothetical protein [Lactobacillus delbrueckii subsp. lactis]